MGKITDLNVTGLNSSKHAALLGDAHEMMVAGLLCRLGFEVGLLAAKGGAYDLWVIAFKDNTHKIQPLRVQIKTVSGGGKGGSIGFTAGGRGGIDRYYKSGVKVYKYTVKDNDLIIGVQVNTLDLYLVPTKFIYKWGKSRAVSKLQPLKNNWDMLLNWNNKFLKTLESKLP
jgi:hypothetical protein